MRNFFDNIPLDNQEISDEQIKKIKASVLSRVKEETKMSKKSTIRMVTIAVAAATTAALSAMIASAEQPAPAPTAVENIVENAGKETGGEAAETETGELPGEAAFKEYIEKAKAEDVGAPEKAPENVNGWIAVDADTGDLVCVQPVNDWTVYYYFRGDDEQLQEMIDSGWSLVDTEINAIHLNEVFVDD